MKVKNAKVIIWILAILVSSSFVFFVMAKEKNTTTNIILDNDQDGLTNAEERLYGTDINNPDTDGDGYSDATEVKSGYDPLKPAPNDKLTNHNQKAITAKEIINTPEKQELNKNNLTQQLAKKIVSLSKNEDGTNKDVSLQKIKELVDQSLNSTDNLEPSTVKVTEKDIKIRKENFSHLSKAEIKQKKKEDFIDYITAVFYIISSNSPEPVTNSSSMASITSQIVKKVTNALATRDTQPIKDISQSGEKMLDQLKELEVPKDLVDIDLKALQFAEYAQNMEQYIKATDDPVTDIANFSRMSGLAGNLISFSQDVQVKFSEYDIKYDEDIKNKLKDYGIDTKNNALIKALINNSSAEK